MINGFLIAHKEVTGWVQGKGVRLAGRRVAAEHQNLRTPPPSRYSLVLIFSVSGGLDRLDVIVSVSVKTFFIF